jgi:hypothetical protein
MSMKTGYIFSGKPSQQVERRKSGYYCLRRLSFIRRVGIDRDSSSSFPGSTAWHPQAKQFEGWRINYTPVADDSLIRVTCGGYLSSPSSWFDVAVGNESNNSIYIGGPSRNDQWSWDLPSWGAGITQPLSVHAGGGGNLSEGEAVYVAGAGYIDGKMRTFVVEEWENTEPGQPAVIQWTEGKVDF